MKSPLLFMVFARPETTALVFERIRRAEPSRLYVAADGPRPDRKTDEERCRAVREIALAVDWPCEVFTKLRPTNAGCRTNTIEALNWFFEHEPEGIILEDDCLPEPTFFRFCDEMLDYYREDPRVMAISGSSFAPSLPVDGASYCFSGLPYIWGWATWRRAWEKYDGTFSDWPDRRSTNWLSQTVGGDRAATSYWTNIYDLNRKGIIDTWDYAWAYTLRKAKGLCAVPAKALTLNIGFSKDATHTQRVDPAWVPPTAPMEFPLIHATSVEKDEEYDRWMGIHFFHIDSWTRRMWLSANNRLVRLRWLFMLIKRAIRRFT
jgi:hypothetical protein